jgi:hypothetical protein
MRASCNIPSGRVRTVRIRPLTRELACEQVIHTDANKPRHAHGRENPSGGGHRLFGRADLVRYEASLGGLGAVATVSASWWSASIRRGSWMQPRSTSSCRSCTARGIYWTRWAHRTKRGPSHAGSQAIALVPLFCVQERGRGAAVQTLVGSSSRTKGLRSKSDPPVPTSPPGVPTHPGPSGWQESPSRRAGPRRRC